MGNEDRIIPLPLYHFTMSEPEYSEPEYLGSIKCGKGRKQKMKIYAVYKRIAPEEQEVIDVQILRILGFL